MYGLIKFAQKAVVLLVSALAFAGAASAQYPDKVVRIIVPYPPGGGVDVIARSLAARLSQKWPNPVIVENKAGAGTNIGAAYVAKAKPDGYVLLLTTDATITTNPHLYNRMSFDPLKDFLPIAHIVDLNLIVLANPKTSVKSMADLVSLAKSTKGDVTYSSSGNGAQANLMFEALNQMAGTKLLHVPYAGMAPALQAALAGEVNVTLGGGTSQGLIESGKLRPIAVSGDKRISFLPAVPTLKEAGYGQIDPRGWVALFAPAGTPTDVVAKIEKDVRAILSDDAYRKANLDTIGFSSTPDTSARGLAELVKRDFEAKKKLVEISRVKLD